MDDLGFFDASVTVRCRVFQSHLRLSHSPAAPPSETNLMVASMVRGVGTKTQINREGKKAKRTFNSYWNSSSSILVKLICFYDWVDPLNLIIDLLLICQCQIRPVFFLRTTTSAYYGRLTPLHNQQLHWSLQFNPIPSKIVVFYTIANPIQ